MYTVPELISSTWKKDVFSVDNIREAYRRITYTFNGGGQEIWTREKIFSFAINRLCDIV